MTSHGTPIVENVWAISAWRIPRFFSSSKTGTTTEIIAAGFMARDGMRENEYEGRPDRALDPSQIRSRGRTLHPAGPPCFGGKCIFLEAAACSRFFAR